MSPRPEPPAGRGRGHAYRRKATTGTWASLCGHERTCYPPLDQRYGPELSPDLDLISCLHCLRWVFRESTRRADQHQDLMTRAGYRLKQVREARR